MIIDYVSPKDIVADICTREGVTIRSLRGERSDAHIVRVRKEIALALRNRGCRLTEIAVHLNRHHTTVMHYLKGTH